MAHSAATCRHVLLLAFVIYTLNLFAKIDGRPAINAPIMDRISSRRRNGNTTREIIPNEAPRSAEPRAAYGTTTTDAPQPSPASTTPSNPDLLLQYLNKPGTNTSAAAQDLLNKLLSKKGGAKVAPPPPPGKEEKELVEIVHEEACADIPATVPYECVQKEFKQTAYSCSLDFYPEVCNVVTKPLATMCPKDYERTVSYQCPKLSNRQLCYSQPKGVQTVCQGRANKAKEASCERTHTQKSCRTEEVTIPWTCYETKEMDLSYACKNAENKTQCAPNLVAVDDACTRETKVPLVYDYEDQQPATECRTVRTKKMCPKTVRSVSLYSCPETYYEKECQMVDIPVAAMCDNPTTVIEEYPCQKTEMKTFKKPCGFGPGKKIIALDPNSSNNDSGDGGNIQGRRKLCEYQSPVSFSIFMTSTFLVIKVFNKPTFMWLGSCCVADFQLVFMNSL